MAKRTAEPAIPSTMMAAVIDRTGGPSVLKVRELPTPEPQPNQVLIAIHTAGIGSWHAQMRDGVFAPSGQRRFRRVLGLDGSGTVVAKGNRVRRFRVGDRVWA